MLCKYTHCPAFDPFNPMPCVENAHLLEARIQWPIADRPLVSLFDHVHEASILYPLSDVWLNIEPLAGNIANRCSEIACLVENVTLDQSAIIGLGGWVDFSMLNPSTGSEMPVDIDEYWELQSTMTSTGWQGKRTHSILGITWANQVCSHRACEYGYSCSGLGGRPSHRHNHLCRNVDLELENLVESELSRCLIWSALKLKMFMVKVHYPKHPFQERDPRSFCSPFQHLPLG